MKNLLIRGVIFTILPLFVLEISARWITKPFWFEEVIRENETDRIDYLFIGSSRVAAAIDTNVLQEIFSNQSGHPVSIKNFGLGYSTMAENFFGLKKLLTEKPSALSGATVFIEAPEGIPDSSTWEGNWIFNETPGYISPFLNHTDLARFWKESGTPVDEKIYVTMATYSKLAYKLPHIRARIMMVGEEFFEKIGGKSIPADLQKSDLTEDAGIRIDKQGVEVARHQAFISAEENMRNQTPMADWEKSILRDLIHLIRSNGGEVVIFQIPLSSVQARPYQTAIRQLDRLAFELKAREWDVKILTTDFNCDDACFPDLWHLSKSQSPNYSRALAAAYFQSNDKPAGRGSISFSGY